MAEQSEKKKGVHWGVTAWVYFHLFMIASWTLPRPPERVMKSERPASVVEAVRDAPNYLLKANLAFKGTPLHYYLDTTGFWQYWNMFSPNPASTDVWIDAEVEYADGKQMIFAYPRMQDLSLTERYFKERYRKFVENSHGERFSYKWPSVAQAIAFQSYQGDGNFPVKVTLRRHYKEVRPLKGLSPPKDYVEPPYIMYAYFTYMVDTEKIKQQVHE
jgi:hypothetical protein